MHKEMKNMKEKCEILHNNANSEQKSVRQSDSSLERIHTIHINEANLPVNLCRLCRFLKLTSNPIAAKSFEGKQSQENTLSWRQRLRRTRRKVVPCAYAGRVTRVSSTAIISQSQTSPFYCPCPDK